MFIAERAGKLLALVRRTFEGNTLMLRGMQVAPEARRQGIGTKLLGAFVAELACREYYCIPYSHLVDFYGREEFEVESSEVSPAFVRERLERYTEKCYGDSEEVSEGSAVSGSEAAASSGLSNGSTKGRCSWLN